MYSKYALDGWNDVSCEEVPRKFVCVCPICINQNSNNTNSSTSAKNESGGGSEFLILAVALPAGIIILVFAIIITICALHKRSKKRQEDKTSAESNPVYGIYQLEEGSYGRQYSTHEIVDDKHYYTQ